MDTTDNLTSYAKPSQVLRGCVELLKPITWFPPMWALCCGLVSAGDTPLSHPTAFLAGALLAGPLVCGASQIVNDWYDRSVDAINEPHRPIPSGRIPGNFGFWYAIIWTCIAQAFSFALGLWVAAATAIGLALAWAYSAPPVRLKVNGWWGNLSVGLSYEGLAWTTGAAIALGGELPDKTVLYTALLYSIGAHGIMTLNDFKSIHGDRLMGIRSLPAELGVGPAARLACVIITIPQFTVVGLLVSWQLQPYAYLVLTLILGQLLAMIKLLKNPEANAAWFNRTGIVMYVFGMMVTASGLGSTV